jgi:hypothetical protein
VKIYVSFAFKSEFHTFKRRMDDPDESIAATMRQTSICDGSHGFLADEEYDGYGAQIVIKLSPISMLTYTLHLV